MTAKPDIVAFCPYSLRTLYPAFSRLLVELAQEGFRVILISPETSPNLNQAGVTHCRARIFKAPKIQHLSFLIFSILFLIKNLMSRGSPAILVGLGPVTSLLMAIALPFRYRYRMISYQPELNEDRLGWILDLHRYVSAKVDIFVDVDPTRLSIRKSEFGMKFRRTFIFPNLILVSTRIDPAEDERNGGVNFVYGGALSIEHDIEGFLEIFSLVRAENDRFHVYPIAHVGQHQRLLRLKNSFGGDKGIIWHREMDRNEYLKALQTYDIGLCSYPWVSFDAHGKSIENLNSKYAAPSKVYDYISSGLVVVVGKHPTLLDLESEGLAVTYEYGDAENIRTAINRAKEMVLSQTRCQRAKFANSRYSQDPYLEKILQEIILLSSCLREANLDAQH